MPLLSSIKDRWRRRGTGFSTNSDGGSSQSKFITNSERSGQQQQQQQQQQQYGGAQNQFMNTNSNDNPFGNMSQPTRRPAGGSAGPHDPPPAYTPPAPAPVANAPMTSSADDRFAFLSTFDTLFLIDDSGSMAGRSWRETVAALQWITPVCTAHDADGIDIHFLNHAADDPTRYRNITSTEMVQHIFNTVTPQGGTPTGIRLHHILKPYLQRFKANPAGTKPLNIVVITDGVPSDDVESVIINAAKQLDKLDAPAWQVGIQFFQVGNEPGAAAALQELDDELADAAGGIRDMVDTFPFRVTGQGRSSRGAATGGELTGESLMKAVLGSVIRRLDRKQAS